MSNLKRLLPVIVVIIIAIAASYIIYTVNVAEYSDWESAQGVVHEIEDLRKFNVRVHYAYIVDGEVYSGSELVSQHSLSEGRKAGDEVPIWYDPDEPANSRYLKPNPTFQATAPIFLTVPICLIIILKSKRGENQ